MNTYQERKEAYINAVAAYKAACSKHAAGFATMGKARWFSSEEANKVRKEIRKANAAREKARRIFDAVATEEDRASILLDAIQESDAFFAAVAESNKKS